MKRFAALFFICSVSLLHAQGEIGVYAGFGYGGTFVSSAGIDGFVSEYNSQRSQILTKKMESPSMFKGFSFF